MNNEEKILEILTQMQAAQTQTNDRLAKLEAGQAKLEADVSGIKSDVSALKGDVSVLKDDVSDIKTQVNYIWEEIYRYGDRLQAQEEIVRKKIM